jgi:ubiquinone/menaquinone biosynthesis C-methylase UbiE
MNRIVSGNTDCVHVHPAAAEGFTRAAATYERARPSYAPAAVAALVDEVALGPATTVVDLGAGTGKFSRLVAASGARVVAVEPVRAMRELIPAGVEALDGTAEAIPVPDAAAAAVVAAQAFHWFEEQAALREIHRVLRPGGALALVRNRRDTDDPVQRSFEEILARHRAHSSLERPLALHSPLFASGELRTYPHEHELAREDLVALAASETSIALLDDEPRTAALAEFERLAGTLPERVRLRYVTELLLAVRR